MSHRSLCALRLAGRPSCRTSQCEAVLMPYPLPARDGAAVESVNAVPSGAAQIVERATARRAGDPPSRPGVYRAKDLFVGKVDRTASRDCAAWLTEVAGEGELSASSPGPTDAVAWIVRTLRCTRR